MSNVKSEDRVVIWAKWEPIETAPKDGTQILMWRDGRKPFVGHWYEWPMWKDWSEHGIRLKDMHAPTHWMPIPDPPAGATHDPSQDYAARANITDNFMDTESSEKIG